MKIEVYLITKNGADARGSYDTEEDKITLLKRSILTIDPNKPNGSPQGDYSKARQLVESGAITRTDAQKLVVNQDVSGLSPSRAYVIVTGRSGSGPKNWRSKDDNRTVEEIRNSVASSVMPASEPPATTTTEHPNRKGVARLLGSSDRAPSSCDSLRQEVLEGAVRALHEDVFQRSYRKNAARDAQKVCGWDSRLREYAYATSRVSSVDHVVNFLLPLIVDFRKIVSLYEWSKVDEAGQIKKPDLLHLECFAETICIWGGVPKAGGYRDTWKVVKSAMLGRREHHAPMDSGWTKVASFATYGLNENEQTIWDSRVSTAVVDRIDSVLKTTQLKPNPFQELSVVESKREAGTRPRDLSFEWPSTKCTWTAHFNGSAIVRQIVQILNSKNGGYPGMPCLNTGMTRPWDVFGVGMVLFMDGY